MLLLALTFILWREATDRTPAIYRCPAKEGETARLQSVVDDYAFDALCIDPKPGPEARKAAAGKVKIVSPSTVDTAANMRWRNATIAFAAGKISPKEWLSRTRNLHETVHLLTCPSTPELRPIFGNESGPAVFAELLLLAWPGRPCLTSGDVWKTRELPDAGRLQSWILAMNDLLGPMLQYRHDNPCIVTGRPTVIRADAVPGLLIYRQTDGKTTLTFYCNNSASPVALPPFAIDHITVNRGIDMESSKYRLMPTGFFVVESRP